MKENIGICSNRKFLIASVRPKLHKKPWGEDKRAFLFECRFMVYENYYCYYLLSNLSVLVTNLVVRAVGLGFKVLFFLPFIWFPRLCRLIIGIWFERRTVLMRRSQQGRS